MRRFTLIEMLVVIAIIGILTSLLMPSLSKAREATRTTVCVNNISQINKSLQIYLSEGNAILPYDAGTQRDTWPSFLDPYIGGASFSGPEDLKRPGMSDIWASCPNSGRTTTNFRDADYAGVFPQSSRWPTSTVDAINQPSESAIFTEGNHEIGTYELGNSWIRVGNGAQDSEYNYITGLSWGKVRHMFGKKFTLSTLDGAAKSTHWITLSSFSDEYGIWVNN